VQLPAQQPPPPQGNQGQAVNPPPGIQPDQGAPPQQQHVNWGQAGNPPQAQAFHQALMRLGLSAVAAQEFVNNGTTTLSKLRTLSADALDMLIKQITKQREQQGANQGAAIFIPFFSQQYIRAIRFWANKMHILGVDYTIEQVTEILAEQWNEIMKTEQEAAKVSTDIIKVPEDFKKDTKWRPWKESVMTYLHSKRGHETLPLAYIICEYDEPLPNVLYATTHDQ